MAAEPKTENFTRHSLEDLRESQQRLRDKRLGLAPQLTPISPEYAKALADAADNSLPTMFRRVEALTVRPQKTFRQTLAYDDAKRLTWAIFQETMSKRRREMVVDEHNRDIITQLIRWFIADPACTYDLQKGIFLFGEVGAGKTMLLQAMQTLTVAARLENRHFKIADCLAIADRVRNLNGKDKTTDPLEKYQHGDYCFDDLGQEPLAVKVYGDDRGVMEPILTTRYRHHIAGKCITHATSNLTPDELETRYGTRVADRFKEMFNYIFLDGTSRRT